MFTPAYARASSAYKIVSAETSVQNANPHYLVHLLYEELLQSLARARGALARNDISAKGAAIGHAVSIIDNGLKAGLNLAQGGELAQNLSRLYDYCTMQLTRANAQNSDAMLQEVKGLIEPVAQAWREISPSAQASAQKGA